MNNVVIHENLLFKTIMQIKLPITVKKLLVRIIYTGIQSSAWTI